MFTPFSAAPSVRTEMVWLVPLVTTDIEPASTPASIARRMVLPLAWPEALPPDVEGALLPIAGDATAGRIQGGAQLDLVGCAGAAQCEAHGNAAAARRVVGFALQAFRAPILEPDIACARPRSAQRVEGPRRSGSGNAGHRDQGDPGSCKGRLPEASEPGHCFLPLAFAALCRACVTKSYTRRDYRWMHLAAALRGPHPLDFPHVPAALQYQLAGGPYRFGALVSDPRTIRRPEAFNPGAHCLFWR